MSNPRQRCVAYGKTARSRPAVCTPRLRRILMVSMVMVKGLGHVACLYGIVNTDPVRWANANCILNFAYRHLQPPPSPRSPAPEPRQVDAFKKQAARQVLL
jgi:hypothetical protein